MVHGTVLLPEAALTDLNRQYFSGVPESQAVLPERSEDCKTEIFTPCEFSAFHNCICSSRSTGWVFEMNCNFCGDTDEMDWKQQIMTCLVVVLMAATTRAQDYKSGMEWQMPPIVVPGATDGQPPSAATILFDGTDLSAWNGGPWKIEEGAMVAARGELRTKESFGDIQLHLEWSAPTEVKGRNQGRGNSGVFLMGRYEVQVLDSYNNETYFDGQAASIYKQTPPMANVMRKPGEWNSYDIFWTAPRFGVDTKLVQPAAVTVVHNGVVVLNHFELYGPTNFSDAPEYKVHEPTGPISLQYHRNPVRFRNIWVRDLKPAVGQRVSNPYVLWRGEKVSVDTYVAKRADRGAQKDQAAAKKAMEEAIQQAVEKALKDERARVQLQSQPNSDSAPNN